MLRFFAALREDFILMRPPIFTFGRDIWKFMVALSDILELGTKEFSNWANASKSYISTAQRSGVADKVRSPH